MKIAIADGPKCPNCGCDGFDDWWHAKTVKRGWFPVEIQGSLRCHSCGRFFSLTVYHDSCGGKCHSIMQTKPKPAQRPAAQ